MLVEFSIIPVGRDASMSDEVAEVLKIVDTTGLPYQLTPTGTVIEGEWAEVMSTIKMCHDRLRDRHSHLVTTIKIEDEEGATNKLESNITSVEEKLGRTLRTKPQ